jgi:hypothetical protein
MILSSLSRLAPERTLFVRLEELHPIAACNAGPFPFS